MQRCGARNGFLEERGVAAEIVVFNGRGNLLDTRRSARSTRRITRGAILLTV
jgi:hypothetical protein